MALITNALIKGNNGYDWHIVNMGHSTYCGIELDQVSVTTWDTSPQNMHPCCEECLEKYQADADTIKEPAMPLMDSNRMMFRCYWVLETDIVIDRSDETHIDTLQGVFDPVFKPDDNEWILSGNDDCPDCEDQS